MRPLPSLNDKSILVVAPHPDDETIAAFGLLHTWRRQARSITVVIVTDGAASHQSKTWPPACLSARRLSETVGAMRRIGLPKSCIRFLGLPDSGLSSLSPTGRRRLVQRLRRAPEPDIVIRPAEEDFHADHRVVADACRQAWPPRVRQLTYLVWPRQGVSPPPARYTLRLGDTRRMKAAALRAYRSQTGLIKDDPDGFVMDSRLIRRFSQPMEIFGDA